MSGLTHIWLFSRHTRTQRSSRWIANFHLLVRAQSNRSSSEAGYSSRRSGIVGSVTGLFTVLAVTVLATQTPLEQRPGLQFRSVSQSISDPNDPDERRMLPAIIGN